ncbi:transcription termination factor Rho [Streptomyces sp. NPDC050560]|uniref:transcription termination factor Rho n=1 Tax=Streptomyces sp. NPDC050560 TaxID=3365630 RepID=UPI0037B2B0CB
MTIAVEAPRTAEPAPRSPQSAHPPHQDAQEVTGVLDLTSGGHGFLRRSDLLPTPSDPRVPADLIRRHRLRAGDRVTGVLGPRGKLHDLAEVPAKRAMFHELTPLHPHRPLRLEHPGGGLAPRVIDLVAPIGKGQRGLIVAPPRAGKTVLLQQIAAAVTANHPDCHLMTLLVDERPEEVTDMRRSVRGEVFASTFDRPPKDHIALAELAVERAKRLVEQGRDVVLLLDSLTRLCRAHNNAAGAGGRTLSGGVDARALHGPKRLFGAARQTEEGGSLTIIATALVETGSRADDYFFEELKSTGNMELRLDRTAAEARLHPAVAVTPSGTRREELLVSPADLGAVHTLRRALARHDAPTALETLLHGLRRTPDNAAFLSAAAPR